jgi:FAD/FMN-containing dehydrogenase
MSAERPRSQVGPGEATCLISSEGHSCLREKLSGPASRSGEKRYAKAASISAKPPNRMPRAVAHGRTVEDVRTAIRAARDCNLRLSIRGWDHDSGGRALRDGVVIDFRGMGSVTVGFDQKVQVWGRALTGDVIAATHPLGLAVVTGAVGAVGIAGLTLGGAMDVSHL